MKISRATPKAVAYACKHFHYSRCVPSSVFNYSVWNDNGEWCGVIVYSYGATPMIGRPFGLYQGEICELVRVALNGKQGHGKTSEAVAATLKALKREAPMVQLVVSFADIDQEHIGTIYQATNWIYVGESQKNERGAFIIRGKKMHPKSVHSKGWRQSVEWLRRNVDPKAEVFVTKGKRKYIYPMNKKMRKKVSQMAKPYPKNERRTMETKDKRIM